jgi:[protein-PII] uridylyltransferase
LDDTIDPATDPTMLLRVAAAAAREKSRIDRPTLDRLAQDCPALPSPWPAGAIDDLVGLLLTGRNAIAVLEALDQRGNRKLATGSPATRSRYRPPGSASRFPISRVPSGPEEVALPRLTVTPDLERVQRVLAESVLEG